MIKVYGGNTFHDGKQVRCVIATTSWKRAAELTGESLSYLRTYWSITGNTAELAAAKAHAGTPLLVVNGMFVSLPVKP